MIDVCMYGIVWRRRRTKLLLDDLQDLALIEFLGQALHGSQGLTSISLCNGNS